MSYDPNQPRDDHGRWGSGRTGPRPGYDYLDPFSKKYVSYAELKALKDARRMMKNSSDYDEKFISGLKSRASLIAPFTQEEVASIKEWTSMSFDSFNKSLRSGSDHYADQIRGIDDAMRKASLDQSVQVYRSMDGDFARKIPLNEKFRDLGFAATTELESVAKKFGWRDPVIFKIDIPKGYRAIPIRAFSHSPDQEEILINRGAKFIRTGRDQLKVLL